MPAVLAVGALAVGVLAPIGLPAQSAERRVGGAELRFTAATGWDEVRGELLATANDTIWIARSEEAGPVPFAFGEVQRIRVRSHDAGARWSAGWVVLGWGVTSLGLTAACSQAGGGCGAVPAIMAIPWGGIGGGAAALNESGTWLHIPDDRLTDLRAYARFPQGLPEAMRDEAGAGKRP